MNPLPILLALLVPLAVTSPAARAEPQDGGAPVVSLQDVRLETYTPLNVDVKALYNAAAGKLSRDVYVSEHGGVDGPLFGNMALMGDRILVYDESSYVDLVLKALARIDQPAAASAPAEALVTREYVPRFASLEAVYDALRAFGEGTRLRSVSLVPERNLLILRDTSAHVAEMLATLAAVDLPEPQAMLTCYVVRGGPDVSTEEGVALPADLRENLAAMVPGFHFGSGGFGLLRSSIAPGRSMALRIETEAADYELSFRVVAYDPATASLTVERCTLEREQWQRKVDAPQVEPRRQLVFQTNALLHGGEYTVLGASGSEPVFLVVYLQPLP